MKKFLLLVVAVLLTATSVEAQIKKPAKPRVFHYKYTFANQGAFGGTAPDTVSCGGTLPAGTQIRGAWIVVSDSVWSNNSAVDSVTVAVKVGSTTVKTAQNIATFLPAEASYAADSTAFQAGTMGKKLTVAADGSCQLIFASASVGADSLAHGIFDFYLDALIP